MAYGLPRWLLADGCLELVVPVLRLRIVVVVEMADGTLDDPPAVLDKLLTPLEIPDDPNDLFRSLRSALVYLGTNGLSSMNILNWLKFLFTPYTTSRIFETYRPFWKDGW